MSVSWFRPIVFQQTVQLNAVMGLELIPLRLKAEYSHSEGHAVWECLPLHGLDFPLPHWPSLPWEPATEIPWKTLLWSHPGPQPLLSGQLPQTVPRLSMPQLPVSTCVPGVPILPNSQKVSWGQDPNPIFPLLLFSYYSSSPSSQNWGGGRAPSKSWRRQRDASVTLETHFS